MNARSEKFMILTSVLAFSYGIFNFVYRVLWPKGAHANPIYVGEQIGINTCWPAAYGSGVGSPTYHCSNPCDGNGSYCDFDTAFCCCAAECYTLYHPAYGGLDCFSSCMGAVGDFCQGDASGFCNNSELSCLDQC
jgi:hypothetical protein